jgi:hypothetical protein
MQQLYISRLVVLYLSILQETFGKLGSASGLVIGKTVRKLYEELQGKYMHVLLQ